MARVTVLQLDPHVPLDRFGMWLAQDGATVDLVALYTGERVPQVAEISGGLLVLGGKMNAYGDSDYPYLADVRTLLTQVVTAHIPTLGICLGHQLLAAAFDGSVTVNAQGGSERGVTEIHWSDSAHLDPVLGPALAAADGRWLIESHDDVVSVLLVGASSLASSARVPVQAFRVGSALGVQFHPEVSLSTLQEWWKDVPSRHDLLIGAQIHDDESAEFGRALATAFHTSIKHSTASQTAS